MKIDKHGKIALSIMGTVVSVAAICTFFPSCSQKMNPSVIQEIAIDVAEEAIDELVEQFSGVDPDIDFNGNDNEPD